MAQVRRIFESLRDRRGVVRFRDFERVLLAFGFVLQRTRGSHRAYAHPRTARPLVIQPRGTDAKPYQVREFLDMIEEHGLRMDE